MISEDSDRFSIIILAAGKGKRMNNPMMAKVMAMLAGKPLIGHVFEQVKKLNPDRTFVIVGHQKDSVIDYVNSINFNNTFFVEQKEQLGTGHAVAQAKEFYSDANENILILSGDVPLLSSKTLKNFVEEHTKHNADLSVLSTFADNPKGYGRIVRNENNQFQKIVEEKDTNVNEKLINEINSGVYFIKSKLLFDSLEKVSNNNAQGEYYLTDIIDILFKAESKVFAFPLAKFDELQGVNSPDDLKKAEDYYYSQATANT